MSSSAMRWQGSHDVSEPELGFGKLLKSLRLRVGLTQEELAERARLSTQAIGALEQGLRRRPQRPTVAALADALGLSVEEGTGFAAAARGSRARAAVVIGLEEHLFQSNLPAVRTPLIGRSREMAELRALLGGVNHLVTVTGVGGSGKTSLALEVASELRQSFADGVWLVELAPIAEPALVAAAVATVLGIADVPGERAVDVVTAFLSSRSMLLVLDNCEHLIDACARLAERILAGCPDARLLGTSREALLLPGEQQFRLAPLRAPEPEATLGVDELSMYPAVQLLVARAQAADPAFILTERDNRAISQICSRLAGLPLAIELAAARLRVLTPDQIVERLDDAFSLLTGGSRTAPSRQQTLLGTLEWSRALLSEPEQAVFRRLAVFAGGCDLEAAETVCSGAGVDDVDVLDLLARLIDKSLLLVEQRAATTRYRLLEPVRQYAQRQLSQANEVASTRQEHARHYVVLAERAEPELQGPHQVIWQELLDLERDNLRAALSWTQECEPETTLRLAVALTPFWERRGYLGEGRQWLSAALAAQPGRAAPSPLQARALVASGRLAHWQADLGAAMAFLERGLADHREMHDERGMAEAIIYLGTVLRLQAAYAEAIPLLEDGLARCRELGYDRVAAQALLGLGISSALRGDLAGGRAQLEEALDLYKSVSDARLVAVAQTMLGGALVMARELQQAAELLAEGLAGHRAVGDRLFVPYNLMWLGVVAALTDRPALAARWLGAAEAHREAQGGALTPASGAPIVLAIDRIRARLSEAEIEEAWSAGRRLTVDEIVANVTQERVPAVLPRHGQHTPATA